jgi:hypothetical protein
MKNLEKIKSLFFKYFMALLLVSAITSCDKDVLDEKPKDFLSPDNTFINKEGFEAGLTALYANARGIHASWQGLNEKVWQVNYGQGADIGYHIDEKNFITDYTIVNSDNPFVLQLWRKFYALVKDANVIITRAEGEDAKWESDEEKNEIIAEAKFFRAFAYRFLVWYFGDVPLVKEEITAPKFDFVRSPASEVIAFMLEDLEFASQYLPTENPTGARLSKAAADYLLAETYNAMGQWDKAIAAADRILNDGQYDLMYNRFGSMTDKPGDVYWDLFRYGNQDRSSGNKENIFAWQFEYNVDGGYYNSVERAWGPFLERLKTPDNKQAILKDEILGRPVTFIRITPWVEEGMWDDFDNDMRNSEYNVQREFFINNPESAFFGDQIQPTPDNHVRNMFPYFKKFTMPYGHPQGYDTGGTIYTDWYVFRVAGVYLLRAEAYLVVRGRAHASPVAPANVDIDYILDERARELLGEEHRRVTLRRLGKLVERTQLYNPVSGPTMQDFNALLPIPQDEIDANNEAELTQNPGY